MCTERHEAPLELFNSDAFTLAPPLLPTRASPVNSLNTLGPPPSSRACASRALTAAWPRPGRCLCCVPMDPRVRHVGWANIHGLRAPASKFQHVETSMGDAVFIQVATAVCCRRGAPQILSKDCVRNEVSYTCVAAAAASQRGHVCEPDMRTGLRLGQVRHRHAGQAQLGHVRGVFPALLVCVGSVRASLPAPFEQAVGLQVSSSVVFVKYLSWTRKPPVPIWTPACGWAPAGTVDLGAAADT